MFMVTGVRLMSRPLEFYQRLLALVDGSRPMVHDSRGNVPLRNKGPFKLESSIMEVLWHIAFGKPQHQIPGAEWIAAPSYL
jgi:hypothetical protein